MLDTAEVRLKTTVYAHLQVLNVQALYAHYPAFAGRRLDFKEYSFLDNPRLPGWIRHSKTEISPGSPSCGLCAEPTLARPSKPVNQQVTIPRSINDTQIVTLLQPYAAAKWLHFTDVSDVLAGFTEPQYKIQYESWLDKISFPWCCRPAPEEDPDQEQDQRSVEIPIRPHR